MRSDSTVTDLDHLAGQAKSARQRMESAWFLNVAYYSGNQWTYWTRGRLYEPQLDPWRVTFTDNRLIGVVRNEVAKMTKQRPIFVATPTTGQEEDVSAAKLSERMLVHLWSQLDLQRKQRSALQWSRICGAGFWKIYWDKQAGTKTDVLVGPDGQPVMGSDGRPMDPALLQQLPPELTQRMKVQSIAPGEVCVEVRSPLEILPDPLAGDEGLSSCEWIIEESVRSSDYVKSRYDIELKEDAEAIAGIAESRMGPMGGDTGSGAYKGVKIREYWSRPSSSAPKGKYVVWAGGKILKEDKAPYDDLPYVMFSGLQVPGRFWPTSMVEQLRPVQTELNKTRSQIRENAARIGNPSLLKSRAANVDYSGLPGEIVEYDDTLPNSVPSYLHPPEMPGYVIQEIDRMEVSIREISGQHEITSGSVPPGVTAASAINLLQEQDDTRLGPDIAEMENTIGEAGQKILKLVGRFYTEGRTVQIAGEDGDWDIFDFKGSMLRDSTHISVQAGSAIPLSKAAKQAAMQQVLQLFVQNGVPVSPRQLARFLGDMEVGGFERLVEQFSADEAQINAENRRLAQGMLMPLNTFDDDAAHVAGHQDFQKSVRYTRLPPDAHMAFEQHVNAHQMRIQQAQEQQMQQEVQQTEAMAKAQAAGQPEKPPVASK